MFYAYRMTQIHQFCIRKDQEKKFWVCSIFKVCRWVAHDIVSNTNTLQKQQSKSSNSHTSSNSKTYNLQTA